MTFLEEVKSFLAQAQREPVAIPKPIINKFKDECEEKIHPQILFLKKNSIINLNIKFE